MTIQSPKPKTCRDCGKQVARHNLSLFCSNCRRKLLNKQEGKKRLNKLKSKFKRKSNGIQ